MKPLIVWIEIRFKCRKAPEKDDDEPVPESPKNKETVDRKDSAPALRGRSASLHKAVAEGSTALRSHLSTTKLPRRTDKSEHYQPVH